MRDYQTIINDIESRMSALGLTKDLADFHDWLKGATTENELRLMTGTWLATFQVYSDYDEPTQDLIEEYFKYCHSNGLYPI